MLKKAQERFTEIKNIHFVNANINNYEIPKCDLVLCIYTLQFTPINVRDSIVTRVFNSLKKHRGFILTEKVTSSNQFYALAPRM